MQPRIREIDRLADVGHCLSGATPIEPDAAPRAELTAQELKMAKLLTEAMSIEKPDLGQYRDGYADRLREVIEAKVAGQKIVESSAPDLSDRVINLMEALEKSLKQTRPAKRRKAS